MSIRTSEVDGVDLVILPPVRDLGDGFSVRRALPSAPVAAVAAAAGGGASPVAAVSCASAGDAIAADNAQRLISRIT